MTAAAQSLAPGFLEVGEHVARNPIARAIARARLAQAALDFAIRLHLLADGEQVQADGLATARVLAVAIRVCELRGQADTPACRVMRGGLEAVARLAERHWRWRSADATAIDVALQHAVELYRGATAPEQQRAHRYVIGLELEVEAARRERMA